MERRAFIKSSVASGLGSYVLTALPSSRALGATPAPLLWINFQGTGGWDQALTLDPKPGLRGPYLDATTYPGATNVVTRGNISYLQFADCGAPGGAGFFGTYANNITVFNGVDTGTNNHPNGKQISASGGSQSPCFSAQVAGVVGSSMALSFLDCGQGGYSGGATLAQPVSLYRSIETFTSATAINRNYLDPANLSAVEAANQARLQRQADGAALSKDRLLITQLLQGRQKQNAVLNLAIPPTPTAPAGTTLDRDMMRLFLFAINAYQAGLTVSVNFSDVGIGFDTHANNESMQFAAWKKYTDYLTWMMTTLDAANIPAMIVCSSDFGRTADRENNGTGHWPISTIFVVHSSAALGKTTLPNNIVIGATDDKLNALAIDPVTFSPSTTGTILTPAMIYSALRRIAGIADAPALAPFPLRVVQELAIG